MHVLLVKKSEDVHIPPRFQQVVALHVLKNMLKKTDVKVPLILGIHGPSGEGKTFQLELILKRMGVKRFLISGGQLDSPRAGEPAQLVRRTYIGAGEAIKSGDCSMSAMLINDIDTGLGMWGKNPQFTQTQQSVFGELMHMVDYPDSVEGKKTLRIPIIITGNDFTRLYAPLMRAGRMTAFEWIPNLDERANVITKIFPELSRDECRRLVVELTGRLGLSEKESVNTLPVAFYGHLRAFLLDEDIWQEVERVGLQRMIDDLLAGNEPNFSAGIHYERVLEKGVELAHDNQFSNHLRSNNNNNHPEN